MLIRQSFAGMGSVSAQSTLPFAQISDLYFTGSNYSGEEQAKIASVIKPFYDNQASQAAARQAQYAAEQAQFNTVSNWLRSVGSFALAIHGGGTANVQYWVLGGALGGPKFQKVYQNLNLAQIQADVNAFLTNSSQPNSSVPASQASTPVSPVTASSPTTSGYTSTNSTGTTIVNPASGVYTLANWNGSPQVPTQNRISYGPTIKDEVDYVKYGLFALVGIGAFMLLKKGNA